MPTTLSLLRKVDTRLSALDRPADGLQIIEVKATVQNGCIVELKKHSFVSHWFSDAAQMTACLVHMKRLMNPGRIERHLFDFAQSIFDQATPSDSAVVWLYYMNLTKLFTDIQDLKSVEFLKLLFSGIRPLGSPDTVKPLESPDAVDPPLVVYDRFEVIIMPVKDTKIGYDAMIYIGLKGRSKGPEYIVSPISGARAPMLLWYTRYDPDTPRYILSPAWRKEGHFLKWIEPASADFAQVEKSKDGFENTLALFKPDTPYDVIGEAFFIQYQLCPYTTDEYDLDFRNEEGVHRVFGFRTNPLEFAMDPPNFVLALTAVGVRPWKYVPSATGVAMECSVDMNYLLVDDDPDSAHNSIQEHADIIFDSSLKVCYKGALVTDGGFMIIRSTKTEKAHSEADSEPGESF